MIFEGVSWIRDTFKSSLKDLGDGGGLAGVQPLKKKVHSMMKTYMNMAKSSCYFCQIHHDLDKNDKNTQQMRTSLPIWSMLCVC